MGLTLAEFSRRDSFPEKLCAPDNEFPCFLFRRGSFGKQEGKACAALTLFQLNENRRKLSTFLKSLDFGSDPILFRSPLERY